MITQVGDDTVLGTVPDSGSVELQRCRDEAAVRGDVDLLDRRLDFNAGKRPAAGDLNSREDLGKPACVLGEREAQVAWPSK